MSELLADAVIQQLNLGYDALQDRLLLKLGLADNTEITVWLTRRVVKALWAMLQGLSIASLVAPEAVDTQKALENFTQEARNIHAVTKKMDPADTYRRDRVARMAEPLLPIECRISSANNVPSALELESRDGSTVRIPLTMELTQALSGMLQFATREASWDLSLVPSLAVASAPAAQPVLH